MIVHSSFNVVLHRGDIYMYVNPNNQLLFDNSTVYT